MNSGVSSHARITYRPVTNVAMDAIPASTRPPDNLERMSRIMGIRRRPTLTAERAQPPHGTRQQDGSSPATLACPESNLMTTYPGLALAGTYSPPFRPLTDEEAADDAARILSSGAHVVWVGLGAPKQELRMARMHPLLAGVTLVGIGAVFDWFAGNVSKAPDWMQKAGLEWLYRLSREPRRLWRRYIWNNPAYLGLLGLQLARHKLKR